MTAHKEWAYHHVEGDWSVRGSYDEPDNIEILYGGEVFRTLSCPGYQIWNYAAHLYDNIPNLEAARKSGVSA